MYLVARTYHLIAVTTIFLSVSGAETSSRFAASQPAITLPTEIEGKRWPVYGGGVMVVAENPVGEPSAFIGYDRNGKQVFNLPLTIPDAVRRNVYSYARGAEGTFAACGLAYAADGRQAPYLAWVSADGTQQKVIRTSPYHPFLVAVAPDGTLWTVGRELNSELGEKGVNLNAGVLRHYDREGRMLDSFLPRSGFKDPVVLGSSGHLAVSRDRVGWLCENAESIEGSAYIEINSLREITRYPLPKIPGSAAPVAIYSSMGMSLNGEVFVVTDSRNKKDDGAPILTLDRSKSEWSKAPLPVTAKPNWVYIYGADQDFAFLVGGDNKSAVRFFRLAQ